MKFERMQEIEEDLFAKVRSIRKTKGREYATDADTLADFKEVAEAAGVTPLQCWLVYVEKHQRAVASFVREGSVKSESIEDRILDVIVYHLLLLGLIEDLGSETTELPDQDPLFTREEERDGNWVCVGREGYEHEPVTNGPSHSLCMLCGLSKNEAVLA